MDIFEESVKTSMTSMLLCLMFMMLFYPYHDTSGIQNSCDRTHGTNAESIHGLVASLMVVLSWWFAQGFYHAFSHGFIYARFCFWLLSQKAIELVKKSIDFLYMRHWTCLVGGGLTMRDYLERLYLERLLWAIRK